jgi:hypothetical protein
MYGLKPVPFTLKPVAFTLKAAPFLPMMVFARGRSRSFAPLKKTAPLRMTGFVFHWRWLAPVALLAGACSFTLKHVAFKLKPVPFLLKPVPLLNENLRAIRVVRRRDERVGVEIHLRSILRRKGVITCKVAGSFLRCGMMKLGLVERSGGLDRKKDGSRK